MPGSSVPSGESVPSLTQSIDAAQNANELLRENIGYRSLRDLRELAEGAGDAVILELCRLRMAKLLNCTEELSVRGRAAQAAGLTELKIAELQHWPTSEQFSTEERICLRFAEQFVMDPSLVSAEQRQQIQEALGVTKEELLDFVFALHVFESYQRIHGLLADGLVLQKP